MHRSSGRAYNTVGGARTTPWYNTPAPLGVPKVGPGLCQGSETVAPNRSGESYKPIIPCYNPNQAGFLEQLYNWGMGIWYGGPYPPK